MSSLSKSPTINIPRKDNGKPISLLSWVLAGRPEDDSPITKKLNEKQEQKQKQKQEQDNGYNGNNKQEQEQNLQ